MKLNNRWKIILAAAGFNLLFEIALRGIWYFLSHPFLVFFIFLVYFLMFILIEDLIGRFKLADSHFMILILIFWYGHQLLLLTTDSFGYEPPFVLGINWPQFIWLTLVWYLGLQTTMAFYIANRLFPRKQWSPLLSKRGFLIILLLNLIYGIIFRLSSGTSMPDPRAFIILAVIIAGLVLLARRSWPGKNAEPPRSQPSWVMDFLSTITVVLFVYFALSTKVVPGKLQYNLVDKTSPHFKVIVAWTSVMALIMYLHRLLSKRPIPV